MIIDSFENRALYYQVHPKMKEAFEFLEACMENPKAAGRYEIEGDLLYGMIADYEPKVNPAPKFEAHHQYIDVQCMLSGSEVQWYAPRKDLTEVEPYLPEKEAAFYAFTGNEIKLNLSEKMFVIYFPEDGHLPVMPDGISKHCVRAVMKLKV